jgi:hypothetical protein
MKNTLQIILLLLSFTTLSCQDDENGRGEVRLTRISATNTLYPNSRYSYTFSYNDQGLLTGYSATTQDDVNPNYNVNFSATLSYDSQNKLADFGIPYSQGWIQRQTFTYGKTGQLDVATDKRYDSAPTNYYAFTYYKANHLMRIDLDYTPGEKTYTYFLKYDETGNIVQQTFHNYDLSGALSFPMSDTRISYDNKRNPFYKLGSFLYSLGLQNPNHRNFFNYFSPNNIIKVEDLDGQGQVKYSYDYQYKYNEDGLPAEVKIVTGFGWSIVQKFEYTIQ